MDGLSQYNPLLVQSIITSIIVVLLILSGLIIYYYLSMRKLDVKDSPKGLALIIYSMIISLQGLVRELLGEKFIKMTPYFLTLLFYIGLSNFAALLGIDNPTSSVTVTLSMGFVTFVGSIVIGIRYQRWEYLKALSVKIKINGKSIPIFLNPLSLIGKITPLISISMRLWGNIFAGSLIASLILAIPFIFSNILPAGSQVEGHPLMLVMSIFLPPLYVYLDLFTGAVQAFVFVLLTMVYWKLEMDGETEEKPEIPVDGLKLRRVERV